MDKLSDILLLPEYRNDPILAPFVAADRDGNGSVSLQELANKHIPGVTGELTVTEKNYALLARAVEFYQDYLKNSLPGTSLRGSALWRIALSKTAVYPGAHFGLPKGAILIQLKPQFTFSPDKRRVDSITTRLIYADGRDYGHLTLARDPKKSSWQLAGSPQPSPLTDLQLSWARALSRTAEVINQHIENLGLPIDLVHDVRKTFFPQVDDVLQQCLRKRSGQEAPSATLSEIWKEIQLQYEDNCLSTSDFSLKGEFLWSGIPVRFFSHRPLSQEAIEILKLGFERFPPLIKAFHIRKLEKDPDYSLSIALLSPAEEEALLGKSSGAYTSISSLVMMPEQALFTGDAMPSLDGIHNLFHELCHSTLHKVGTDPLVYSLISYGMAPLHRLSRFLWSPLLGEDKENPKHFGDSGAVLTDATIGIGGALLVGPKLIKPLPAKLIVGGIVLGLWVDSEYFSLQVDKEGLLKEAFKHMQRANKGSVSRYAETAVEEFSAETLFAYSQTKEDVARSGLYSPDPSHGLKTREELLAKHPEVYLAYAAYFEADSSARDNPDIFTLSWDDIHRIVANYMRSDGTLNVASARKAVEALVS